MLVYLLFIAFLLAVYEETNTIWFSEYIVQEETMYKLIGVSINRYNRFYCVYINELPVENDL